MASGSLLAGLIVHKARYTDKLVALFTLAFTAGTIGTFLLGEFMYDRYLLAILPGVRAVALLPEPASARIRAEAAPIAWARRSAALLAGLTVTVVGLMLLT
jgi:hypothetical protein